MVAYEFKTKRQNTPSEQKCPARRSIAVMYPLQFSSSSQPIRLQMTYGAPTN